MNVYHVCVQVPTETKEGYKWKNSREEARKLALATLWKINGYCYMLPPCGMVCYPAPSADLESQVQGSAGKSDTAGGNALQTAVWHYLPKMNIDV